MSSGRGGPLSLAIGTGRGRANRAAGVLVRRAIVRAIESAGQPLSMAQLSEVMAARGDARHATTLLRHLHTLESIGVVRRAGVVETGHAPAVLWAVRGAVVRATERAA